MKVYAVIDTNVIVSALLTQRADSPAAVTGKAAPAGLSGSTARMPDKSASVTAQRA
jgi:hypothetical protein